MLTLEPTQHTLCSEVVPTAVSTNTKYDIVFPAGVQRESAGILRHGKYATVFLFAR